MPNHKTPKYPKIILYTVPGTRPELAILSPELAWQETAAENFYFPTKGRRVQSDSPPDFFSGRRGREMWAIPLKGTGQDCSVAKARVFFKNLFLDTLISQKNLYLVSSKYSGLDVYHYVIPLI